MVKKFIIVSLILICLIIFLEYYRGDKKILSVNYISPANLKEKLIKDNEMYFDNKYFSKGQEVNCKKATVSPYKGTNTELCYESLDSNEERYIYKMIKENTYKIYSKFDPKYEGYPIEPIEIKGKKLEAWTIRKIVKAVQWDNPDIFWLSNTISFIKKENETLIKLSSVIPQDECNIKIEKLNKAISKILESMPKGMSEYERELYMHDWIIKNCSYDKSTVSSGRESWIKFTALGPILYGGAVCEGFAKAMKLLLCNTGVDCRLVTGNKGSDRHMWNLVKLGSNWYHVDTTWDSIDEMGMYNYFNLSDEIIKYDHDVDIDISKVKDCSNKDKYNFKLPQCLSIDENYIYKNSIRLDSFDKKEDNYIIEQLRRTAYKKNKYLYIVINQNMDYNSTIKKLFSEKPYKFFYYINEINNDNSVFNRINKNKIYFTENIPMRTVTVELNYV